MSGDPCVIIKVGSVGGSVTLLGQSMPAGGWRFTLTSVDHTAELVSEKNVARVGPPSLEWVDSLDEQLGLLDRYPWVELYPQAVHPLFVEDVRLAVAERLAKHDERNAERIRQKWERLFTEANLL